MLKLIEMISKAVLIFALLMLLSMYGVSSVAYGGGKGHDKGKGNGHSDHGNGNGYGHDKGGCDHGDKDGPADNDGPGDTDSPGSDDSGSSDTDSDSAGTSREGNGTVRANPEPPCSVIDWFNNGFECPEI